MTRLLARKLRLLWGYYVGLVPWRYTSHQGWVCDEIEDVRTGQRMLVPKPAPCPPVPLAPRGGWIGRR
jgi:hypothetical protein